MKNSDQERRTDWGLSFEQQIAFRMWPELSGGAHFLDVAGIAHECTQKSDIPHSIAAVLLLQQISEQLLMMIDYWCFYEKALGIFPTAYEYSEPRRRMMFGEILQRIEQHQEFPGKALLVDSCNALNSRCRIPVAHRLMEPKSFESLVDMAAEAKKHFESVRFHFMNAQRHFMARFDALAEKTGIADLRSESGIQDS